MAPNWDMKGWKKGPVTFMEALGFSNTKLKFPDMQTALPDASAGAQHPIEVSGAGGTSGGSGKPPVQKGSLVQYARKLLVQNGWSTQFAAFNSLAMSESGWNPHIKNPSTKAYGIAQALGHGKGAATQGTESNNYGGFGLTDKQAKEANSGNGFWQLVWMMNYIKDRYGNPEGAWAYHQAHNSY